jgi:peptidoglycan/LPS O-acetylase OafA/YrhL
MFVTEGSHRPWIDPLDGHSSLFYAARFSEAFINAGAAVVFFFVLSGFVLAKSFSSRRQYGEFYLRRAFRIFPAMIVSVLVLAALRHFLTPLPHASAWSDEYYNFAISITDVVRNIFLLGYTANGVTWSMAVECVGSILLPAFVIFQARMSTRTIAVIGVILTVICGAFQIIPTVEYLFCFWFGCALANDALRSRITLPLWLAVSVAFAVIGAIGIAPSILTATAAQASSHAGGAALLLFPHKLAWLRTVGYCFASIVFLASAIRYGKDVRYLGSPALAYLGRISYSLYLFHPAALLVVAFAFGRAGLDGWLVNIPIALVSIPVALAICKLSYQYVEAPWLARAHRVISIRKSSEQPS